MNNIGIQIGLSLLTGIVSSSLVVIYFEIRQLKKYTLSRGHILERLSRELFSVLTIIRVSSGLKLEKLSQDRSEILKNLEKILGRHEPSLIMNKIINLTPKQHQNILNQLINVRMSLSALFTNSVGHKTVEDSISASIAEMEGWIDSVLNYYTMFPEIIEGNADSKMLTFWSTSIFNLIENTFTTLEITLKKQHLDDTDLRWGARSKK